MTFQQNFWIRMAKSASCPQWWKWGYAGGILAYTFSQAAEYVIPRYIPCSHFAFSWLLISFLTRPDANCRTEIWQKAGIFIFKCIYGVMIILSSIVGNIVTSSREGKESSPVVLTKVVIAFSQSVLYWTS